MFSKNVLGGEEKTQSNYKKFLHFKEQNECTWNYQKDFKSTPKDHGMVWLEEALKII